MSTDGERPLLAWEHARSAYELGDREAFAHLPRPPHCDARLLHAPEDDCDFCDGATELQVERERLNISNSGRQNRKWPCPADQARSKAQYHAWPGNRAKTYAKLDEEATAFAQWLDDNGLVVKK